MKRLFIAVLLTLLLAAALAAAIAYDPGYILIAFGLYTLETTFWVGVALLLAVLVLMYLIVLVLHRGLRQGSLFSRWRASRALQKGRQLTTRGILALHEGNFERARRILERSASRSDMPLINYLLAARASAELGDTKQAQTYLLRAEHSSVRPGLALDLARAELQLRNGQLQDSLATLTAARRRHAKNGHVLKLLRDVYLALRDWSGLLKLLPDLRRHKVLPADELAELELRATIGAFDDAAAHGQAEQVRALWQKVPRALARNARVVAAYTRALAAVGAGEEAERLLRVQLKREWNRELVLRYGEVSGADGARQLASAEDWLAYHRHDPALLLTLGRLCLRDQLWGKARDYFESSLKLEENPATCAELGRLLGHLGQHERSSAYYERGLRAAGGVTALGVTALALPGRAHPA